MNIYATLNLIFLITFSLNSISRWAYGGELTLSLSFPEAVKMGLENNLDLFAQKLSIPLAEAQELMVGALANPSLQLDTQLMPLGSAWDQTSTGGPTQQDAYFNIPIDLTKKRSKSQKAAHQSTLATEAQFQNLVLQKKAEIQNSYISLTLLQSLVALYQDRQEIYDQLKTMIANRTRSTRLLPQLLERARVASAQVKFELETKNSELAQEAVRLSALLGQPTLSQAIKASTTLQGFLKYLKPVDFSQFIDKAHDSRFDLKAIQLQRVQANFEFEAAHARILDDVILIAGTSRQGGMTPNPNPLPGAWSWMAGVIIPFPVFSQNKGGIMRSRLLQEQADAQKKALEMQIGLEIQIAVKSLNVTSRQLKEFESSTLESARKVRDGVQRLFGTGSISLLEYMDSINAYYGLANAYYQTLSEHRKAVTRLNLAIGMDILP